MIWVQTEHIYGFPIDNYVNQIYHYFSRSMIHRMTQNSKVIHDSQNDTKFQSQNAQKG